MGGGRPVQRAAPLIVLHLSPIASRLPVHRIRAGRPNCTETARPRDLRCPPTPRLDDAIANHRLLGSRSGSRVLPPGYASPARSWVGGRETASLRQWPGRAKWIFRSFAAAGAGATLTVSRRARGAGSRPQRGDDCTALWAV